MGTSSTTHALAPADSHAHIHKDMFVEEDGEQKSLAETQIELAPHYKKALEFSPQCHLRMLCESVFVFVCTAGWFCV